MPATNYSHVNLCTPLPSGYHHHEPPRQPHKRLILSHSFAGLSKTFKGKREGGIFQGVELESIAIVWHGHQSVPLLLKDNSTLYQPIAKMPLPQLLVGKVAAITGGLTGIGRVCIPFIKLKDDSFLTIPGHCPRIPPPRRQSSHQPLRRAKRRSTPRDHQQRRSRDHRITREEVPHYYWGCHAAGDREGVYCKNRG